MGGKAEYPTFFQEALNLAQCFLNFPRYMKNSIGNSMVKKPISIGDFILKEIQVFVHITGL